MQMSAIKSTLNLCKKKMHINELEMYVLPQLFPSKGRPGR